MWPRRFRYLECVVPASNIEKFWCYWIEPSPPGDGIQIQYRWGRIGTTGQRKVNRHASPKVAQTVLEQKVADKLRKGYVVRDRAWVARMWGGWLPDMPKDGVNVALDQIGVDVSVSEASAWAETVQMVRRAQPRRTPPVVVTPTNGRPRRVIDFTEDD
jgi:predicted DNA-binding WGR domain protein